MPGTGAGHAINLGSALAADYRALASKKSGPQRVYTCVPRLLVQVKRSPLTVRRTWVVHCSSAFEQLATTCQPEFVCLGFRNVQNVLPAQAPAALMMVGSRPCRKSRTEQALPSGAHTPKIAAAVAS